MSVKGEGELLKLGRENGWKVWERGCKTLIAEATGKAAQGGERKEDILKKKRKVQKEFLQT